LGTFRPDSDLDVGFGSLTVSQVARIVVRISSIGPLQLETTRIVPGNQTPNIPLIQSPEEFFQRSGIRAPGDPQAGLPFNASGSYTFHPDGSITVFPPGGCSWGVAGGYVLSGVQERELKMRCRVNGQDIEPRLMARRPMNFQQAFPSVEPAVSYEIAVPAAEFVAHLCDTYQRMVQEEIADAPYHQTGDWPVLDRLQELGYPPLEQMIAKHAALFGNLVREWLAQETLDHLIPGVAEEFPEYIVNSVDCVAVDQQCVRIQGKAYRHPLMVQQS
jgi:hypothetical protein